MDLVSYMVKQCTFRSGFVVMSTDTASIYFTRYVSS